MKKGKGKKQITIIEDVEEGFVESDEEDTDKEEDIYIEDDEGDGSIHD